MTLELLFMLRIRADSYEIYLSSVVQILPLDEKQRSEDNQLN